MIHSAPAVADRHVRRTYASILGIGTASPAVLTQQQCLELASALALFTSQQQSWLKRIYLSSGIQTRGTVLAHGDDALAAVRQFYPPSKGADDRGPTTAQRMAHYAVAAPALAETAALGALADADVQANEITHLITASCTGFFAPGLDAAMIERLHLSPAVTRLHVGFMGCHAAFNAMAAARDAVLTNPKAKVLLCCVELCSLHLSYSCDMGQQLANALFADGAAAVVLGQAESDDSSLWQIIDSASLLVPETSEAMTWRIGDHGFEMTLSPRIPEIVHQHIEPWCREWLSRNNLSAAEISDWAVHPGGPKILTAVAESLQLGGDALAASRKVLSDHGNMSSATVLFILQQLAKAENATCVAIGLGPGLMMEGLLLARSI